MKSKTAAGAKAKDGKKAAAPATVDPGTGIRIDKVKADLVDRYLSELGLPTTGPIGDRLKRLAEYLDGAQKDPTKRAKCEDCGGLSDVRFCRCPYCGGDEQTGKDNEAAEKAALKELRAKKPAAEKATPKSTAQEKGEKAVPESRALVPAAPPAAVLADGGGDVEEHFTNVRLIREKFEQAVGDMYDVGVLLRENFDKKLYLRVRSPGTGQPVYESWTSFVSTELEGVCTVQYSYTLMAVVRAFPRELVLKHGPKKLNLLLRITDPEMLKEVEGKLDQGLTVKQLQAKVAEAATTGSAAPTRPATEGGAGFGGTPNLTGRPKKDSEPPSQPPRSELTEEDYEGIESDGLDSLPEPRAGKKGKDAEPGPSPAPVKGKVPVAPPAKSNVITVTLVAGVIKTNVLARPTKKGAEPKPCKRIGEDPFWEIELPNGAKLLQKIVVKPNGQWQVHTTPKAAE